MKITSNFSITKLFSSKDVLISVIEDDDNNSLKKTFILKIKTIRDLLEDLDWNGALHIYCMSVDEWRKIIPMEKQESFGYLELVLFELGKYRQYSDFADNLRDYLSEIIPDLEIDYKIKQLRVNDIIITSEIWNYIVYLLKLSNGEKATKPRVFSTPEEKAFFLKQQEMERRIKKIRQDADKTSGGEDETALIKIFLSITYSFPSLTFDYLFDQTMAQIRWLQSLAAGEASYRVNAQAFAAGNMKKGKKLDFFIK